MQMIHESQFKISFSKLTLCYSSKWHSGILYKNFGNLNQLDIKLISYAAFYVTLSQFWKSK